MRYFNLKQHTEPRSMFTGERKVKITELEAVGIELSEAQAKELPKWGSGNISVDNEGNWKWVKVNHDTSG